MKTLALLALSPLLGLACSKPPEAVPPETPVVEHKAITTEKLEPYTCGNVQRLHTFAGIFLASQPEPADFEQAKKGGVKSVINLRHAKEQAGFDEAAHVQGLGLAYVNLPWEGPDELTDEIFERARTQLKNAEKPVLVHCSSANRVGAIWIPYRVLDGGLDLEAAVAEAKVVGLKSPDYERKAREYVARQRKG